MRENIVDLTAEKLPVLGRTMVSSSRSRMNVAADDTYNVELLLVIDYSIYLRYILLKTKVIVLNYAVFIYSAFTLK